VARKIKNIVAKQYSQLVTYARRSTLLVMDNAEKLENIGYTRWEKKKTKYTRIESLMHLVWM
jgi:hypothetical protein